MKMMENCKRVIEKQTPTTPRVICAFLFGLLSLMCFPLRLTAAHFIHIDQNEFRASGFPRPPQNWQLPPPIDNSQHLSAKELTPVEVMVDLTNDLTYRILHYHSILNRNNFALSPTALMSVLVALYEGAAGRSAQELSNVLQLPRNRDVIRVGYRDIHRRLRTYFFGSENPLKGLSLNKDNVTISRDYETVLMFYGYDLGMDMVSSTIAPSTTTTVSTIVDAATTTESNMATTTEMVMTEETTTATEITTTTEILTTAKPTDSVATTTEETITETTIPTTTTTTTETTTTEVPTTEAPTTTEAPPTDATEDEGEIAELVSSFVAEADAEPFLRIQKARVSRLPNGRLQAPAQKAPTKTAPNLRVNYLPSARNGLNSMTNSNRGQSRNKRHLFGGFKELDANLFVTLFSPQSGHGLHSHIPISGPVTATGPGFTHNYELNVEPQFVGSGPSAETKQNYNTDVISHVFYLGNQQLVHTTFKVYNAVLYYKYFDNLKMSVLELELDTPEYNLMILLPDFHTDLVTAAAALRLGPTLRLMRKQLKPRWVQAIIPDFKLHGTMFLTNDLQNMGICDIFEPNRADFRPMTEEKGVYVKHIEQSINVNIRTHPINQLKRNYGSQTQPIQISVNHPFMFFIVDRDLDVAVMAGRILNPLNVRIQ